MIRTWVDLTTRILTVALAMQISGPLIAQNSGQIQNARSTRPLLLQAGAVQEELGMSQDQIRDSKKLGAEFQAAVRAGMLEKGVDQQELTNLSPNQRLERMRAIVQAGSVVAQETERQFQTRLDLLLEPEQNRRLREIQIQVLGLSALKLPEVASQLGLTAGQKAEMAKLEEEARQLIHKSIEESAKSGTDADFAKKMRIQRQEIDAKILGQLDAKQKELFQRLKGPVFDISKLLPKPGSDREGKS